MTFGGVAASAFSVTNATSIFAITPAHAAGAVDVVVTTPGGTGTGTGVYTYIVPPPPASTISAVSPGSGPTVGGTTVSITGTDFTGATDVTFGGVAASAFTVNSATSISATTPAHAAGAVSVVVTTPGGTGATSGTFTYVATPPQAPVVGSVSPSPGPVSGGTGVTITGANFTGVTAVSFGGAAAALAVNSATSISVVTPAHAAGAVDVTVTASNGTAIGTYTYAGEPAFVSARSGADSGQCPMTAPCATLNYALSVSGAGGQIKILDGGSFGPIVITQAVTIEGPANDTALIVAEPSAQVGCIGALPGGCALTNHGYAVEIVAGTDDAVTLSHLQMETGTNGAGALKVGSAGVISAVHNVFHGNDTASGPIVAVTPGGSGSTQVYMSDGEIAFNKNGGGVLVAPAAANNARLQFSRMQIHHAVFGIKTDASALAGGSSVLTSVSETAFFSFSGSAVTALSVVGAGAVNSVFRDVNVLNSGGPAVNANGPNSTVILTGGTLGGNQAGVKISNGATVLSPGNNTIKRNGVDVSGAMTASPLK